MRGYSLNWLRYDQNTAAPTPTTNRSPFVRMTSRPDRALSAVACCDGSPQLTCPFRAQNSWYCLQQDVEIEPRRPIADIEKILFPQNLQIALAPRRDLP
jgi:hypothetical protein